MGLLQGKVERGCVLSKELGEGAEEEQGRRERESSFE